MLLWRVISKSRAHIFGQSQKVAKSIVISMSAVFNGLEYKDPVQALDPIMICLLRYPSLPPKEDHDGLELLNEILML